MFFPTIYLVKAQGKIIWDIIWTSTALRKTHFTQCQRFRTFVLSWSPCGSIDPLTASCVKKQTQHRRLWQKHCLTYKSLNMKVNLPSSFIKETDRQKLKCHSKVRTKVVLEKPPCLLLQQGYLNNHSYNSHCRTKTKHSSFAYFCQSAWIAIYQYRKVVILAI